MRWSHFPALTRILSLLLVWPDWDDLILLIWPEQDGLILLAWPEWNNDPHPPGGNRPDITTPVDCIKQQLTYSRWELPQAPFLLWGKFCHVKLMLVTTNTCLSQQNTSFVAIKVCLPQQNFCHNKIMFVVTKYFCHGKTFVIIFLCLSWQTFVATSILLSWQTMCFVTTNMCLS